MSVLSGVGSLATPAAAQEHWLSQISPASSRELSGKQAAAAWARLTRGQHLRRLLSAREVEGNPSTSSIRDSVLSAERAGVASPSPENINGVRHRLEGGGHLLALSYKEGDALIVSYQLDEPGQERRLFSQLIEDTGSEDLVWVLAEAEDDDVVVAPQGEFTAASTCRGNRDCAGACNVCRCVSYNRTCAANCCAPCAFACRTGWTCLGCVLVWCPACVQLNRCCRRRECRWRQSCA